MKAFQYIALALVLISGLVDSASAYSFRLEIVSTDTVDGHAGYLRIARSWFGLGNPFFQ